MALPSLGAGLRWVAVGVALVMSSTREGLSAAEVAGGLSLVGVAAWSTAAARRTRSDPGPADRALLVGAEVGLGAAVVAATGWWSSPFTICLLAAVVAVGLARGLSPALAAAGGAALAVGAGYAVVGPGYGAGGSAGATKLAAVVVLGAAAAGTTRHVVAEIEHRRDQTLNRISQLSEANDLLVSLHRVAQSLPASLDLKQVLGSTMSRLRGLIDADFAAILLRDEATGDWTAAAVEGATLAPRIAEPDLPAPARAAMTSAVASLVVSVEPGESLGPEVLARSGLYAPLRARGTLIGIVALEHHEPGFYGRGELRLLDGLIEPAALALDNARWFGRLRAIGADEERIRIARDMHDRVGQSLAYIAYKLDRLAPMAAEAPLGHELEVLRSEVRGVLTEVRDTLSDLRTEVSERTGLVDTLEAFLERVERRSDLEVEFVLEGSGRLPVTQERELWRIAHEAVSNVERHARATHLTVRWECDGRSGRLVVGDDGRGFAPGPGPPDAFGITGMRERADAIGARLDITSELHVGTVVDCRVPAAAPAGAITHNTEEAA